MDEEKVKQQTPQRQRYSPSDARRLIALIIYHHDLLEGPPERTSGGSSFPAAGFGGPGAEGVDDGPERPAAGGEGVVDAGGDFGVDGAGEEGIGLELAELLGRTFWVMGEGRGGARRSVGPSKRCQRIGIFHLPPIMAMAGSAGQRGWSGRGVGMGQ